jgi:5-(carboxyamino)imidazole ribonucleotide synthase
MTNRTPIKPGATIGDARRRPAGPHDGAGRPSHGLPVRHNGPDAGRALRPGADRQIVARYDDVEAAASWRSRSDVITYEFENVDAAWPKCWKARIVCAAGQPSAATHAAPACARSARSRSWGVRSRRFARSQRWTACGRPIADLGLPAVLKTATGGYDGKGQWVIRSEAEIGRPGR